MRFVLLILLFFSVSLLAQKETGRWEKTEPQYVTGKIPEKKSAGGLLSGVQKVYKFTISDLDGDNCPFYPSCSTFFVEAGKKAGVFRAALMFADRFTRDTNLFKSRNHYHRHESGKFYDPVDNYLHYEKFIHF